MLRNTARFLSVVAFTFLLHAPAIAEDSQLQVVTSFSILEDLVNELGGEYVNVVNLVGRNSDAHMYRPVPSDLVAIQNADLVVFNGLRFEGWIARLIEGSNQKSVQLVASAGIEPIILAEEFDPHAWQSFHNIRVYVRNITHMLITLMPQHTEDLTRRQQDYLAAVQDLENELSRKMAATPVDRRVVVTSHDAFGYLGREFDIQFLAPLGLSVDEEASAEDVASVIHQIRVRKVTALFLENISNPGLLNSISAETGVAIGGRLYSDALSEVEEPAGTYLGMMRHNLKSLIDAFNSSKGDVR